MSGDPIDKKNLNQVQMMEALGETLSELFPGMNFCLLIAPFGAPGIGNYISNGSRETMIEMLKETAKRLENNQDKPRKNPNE